MNKMTKMTRHTEHSNQITPIGQSSTTDRAATARRAVGVLGVAAGLASGLMLAQRADAFAYSFAGSANGVDLVAHPKGYTGSGGNLDLTVGIDPTSEYASQMVIPTKNVISTWNGLNPTTQNLSFSNNVPSNRYDFESVLLHEMGHSLGLTHPNLADQVSSADSNYTTSTLGSNGSRDLNPGSDGVIGSADDQRGDDVNLNYFKKADNDPFTLPASNVVDSTTYSRQLSQLPAGDNYSANADRDVAGLLGFNNTEGVLQQGTFNGEAQRTLSADDVAGIRYAMSGLDDTQGTGDDYTFSLDYAGQTTNADIVIDFDDSQTGFAVTELNGSFLGPDDIRLVDRTGFDYIPIFFNNLDDNQNFSFFFNDQLVPEPTSLMLLIGGSGLMLLRRRRTC